MRKALMLAAVGVVGATALPHAAVAQSAFEQLLAQAQAEVEAKDGRLVIGLDWPESDALPVMEQLQKDFPWITEIEYTRETGIEPFGRYLIEMQQGTMPPYDIMHVASEFQGQFLEAGAFQEPLFTYEEIAASLPEGWPALDERAIDPDGQFLSTTGNQRGIVYNTDLVTGDAIPETWEDCLDERWRGQVVLDARSKIQAFQHDPPSEGWIEDWLAKLVENEVVLVRGQGSIVNMIATGENPIACAMNYHTVYRTIERDGVDTIAYVQPEPIPLELGTRLFVPEWTETPAMAQLFAVWVATAGQEALGTYAYRGFPWNERAHKYEQSQGKEISLCEAECADNWEEYNRAYQDILGIPTVGD